MPLAPAMLMTTPKGCQLTCLTPLFSCYNRNQDATCIGSKNFRPYSIIFKYRKITKVQVEVVVYEQQPRVELITMYEYRVPGLGALTGCDAETPSCDCERDRKITLRRVQVCA